MSHASYTKYFEKKTCTSITLAFVHVPSVDYSHIGCFKDKPTRAISSVEGLNRHLDGLYGLRKEPIEKCAEATFDRNYKDFGVQNGGECHTARDAHLTYDKYGKSNVCKNGEGGSWANDVYHVTQLCFK